MHLKKDKSSHGFHGLLCFKNKVVQEICVIREIRACFVETGVLFSKLLCGGVRSAGIRVDARREDESMA